MTESIAQTDEISRTEAPARVRRFRFDRPQQFAALLIFFFLLQCFWVSARAPLTGADYQFARCGREMWERPSPIAGYFTTCGNIHDGTLTYRLAGLPLSIERILLRQSRDTSTWEMRHELSYVRLLLRLPFIFAAFVLAGALWWVTRRLFGNAGGFIALAFYCVSPAAVRAATSPNSEILTALGFFAAVYTAMGVAHALQGPPRKWRPRIVLLAGGFGIVAASHSAAVLIVVPLAALFMVYLAERRRTAIPLILLASILGAFALLFASYGFRPDALSYYFRSGAARLALSYAPARHALLSLPNAGLTIAASAAVVLYLSVRRSWYFGNTAPLLVALILLGLLTTGSVGEPWFWAFPFLFTFIAGVFADALETRHRRIFLIAVIATVALQACLSIAALANPAF